MHKTDTCLLVFACISLIMAVLSCCFIWRMHHIRQAEQHEYELLEDAVVTQPPELPSFDNHKETQMQESVRAHDCAALHAMNPDCIGWLSIPGTIVSYPLMYTPSDPQAYLHHSFYGAYSASGTPFLDYRCNTACDNLIVYGHNMSNGSMFGSLKHYRTKTYLNAHTIIVLELGNVTYTFQIFAVSTVDRANEWYSFHDALTMEQYHTAVQELADSAEILVTPLPEDGTKLLTLSTCTGATKNERLIVVAKLIP